MELAPEPDGVALVAPLPLAEAAVEAPLEEEEEVESKRGETVSGLIRGRLPLLILFLILCNTINPICTLNFSLTFEFGSD